MANQAIGGSQQFTDDLLGQSVLNAPIQDDNSYVTSSSPVQFTPDLTGQSLLNTSIQDDNSYINSPPSPGFAAYNDMAAVGQDNSLALIDDTSSVDDANALAMADDDMSAAIF